MATELAAALTATDDQRLLAAEQQVRDYCGWHIAPERDEALTLDGSGAEVMLLPTLHLVAVTSVTNDGTALDVDADIEWSAAGILRRTCGCWTRKYRGVVATMTHGYESVPADVSGVVRDIASRAKSSGGLKSKTIGPFSESYSVDLLSTETAILDRYKLPSRP